MSTILAELRARDFLQDCTDEAGLSAVMAKGPVSFYCGFDATAQSLQAGNLIPIVAMRWLQRAGHKPIVVLGSVTSMIGDPSGKSDERKLLDEDVIEKNTAAIEKQMHALFDGNFTLVKNGDWLSKLSYVEFLRDVGKHISINMMIAKDSVRERLHNREQGISYTEFSYMLLQAYDFYWLHQNRGCLLQLGGSDQWGNITAGTELIRRKAPAGSPPAFGLTFPLLTTSSGVKFGKSAHGAIWIDPKMTSPYQFYQYWLNTADADVGKGLRFFTFLPIEEIKDIEAAHQKAPHERLAQKRIALELTNWIHGKSETEKAIRASEILFGGDIAGCDAATLKEIFADVPSTSLSGSEVDTGISIVDLLLRVGAADSKGSARRLVEGGGVYVNSARVGAPNDAFNGGSFIEGAVLILRSGKRNYYLVQRA